MRGFFWLTLLDGFQDNILLGLSNIFDTGVHSIKCITIYKLIENYDDIKIKQLLRKKVDKHNKTIENLIIWRGHYLAHKNELFVAKITNLSDKFPIKWGEITDLLNLCIDVVSKNPRNFDEKDATSYKKYYQINRRKCEQDTKFVFEYGLDTPEYRKLKRKK